MVRMRICHMEGQQDSLWPLQRLVKTWATGARDAEIDRVIQVLKDVLRGRGRDIRCERREEA